jgi:hypothetical protein
VLFVFVRLQSVVLYWIKSSGQKSHDQNLAPRFIPNL